MRRRSVCCIAAISAAALAQTALAQQDVQRRLERAIRTADPAERMRADMALGLGERSVLDFGGYAAFSYVHLNDSTGNSRRLAQPEVTLYGRSVIDGAHTFFARARFQYQAFSQGDSFDGRGDDWTEPFLDRYWYEFDMRRASAAYEGRSIAGNINLRVGRQFIDWGQGLVLSENLYALRPTFEVGRFTFEGLAGVTPGDQSVTDFDASWRGYDDDVTRGFFGGRLIYTTPGLTEFYTYVIRQVDYNDDREAQIGLLTDVSFEYNSTYLGFGSTGSFTPDLVYLGEFVYEFGESQSDPLRGAQVDTDIGAWAARGQLTYVVRDTWQSRVEFETIFASGDADRLTTSDTVGGNQAGTTDKAFNSMGFVNTGLAFSPSLSNIMTYRLGASTYPFTSIDGFQQFQVGVDFFALNKMDPRAPIDEPTSDDRFLGFETDLYANYRITSDLAVTARYGVFFPSAAIESEKDTRHFVFLGVTLSF